MKIVVGVGVVDSTVVVIIGDVVVGGIVVVRQGSTVLSMVPFSPQTAVMQPPIPSVVL